MNIYNEYFNIFKLYFPKILTAIVIFAIGWWLSDVFSKMIKKAMTKAKLDSSVTSFSYSILKLIFKIVAIVVAVSALGVNTSSIVAAFGAALVTVGLAMKDSLSNVASGFLIIISKLFKVNDYLETDKFSGTVKKIEIMFTTLVTSDNKEIVVPNSIITSSHVINCTANKTRKIDLTFTIDKNSNIEEQKEKIRSIVLENPNILKDNNCEIYTEKIGETSIDVKLSAWCLTKDYGNVVSSIQDRVNSTILKNVKNPEEDDYEIWCIYRRS